MSHDRAEMMVESLLHQGVIRSDMVKEAMMHVNRVSFVPDHLNGSANEDRPLPIGEGQTISAPHMVAIMSEELELEPGMKVLEIGTGSGYHAAVTSRMIGSGGWIYSIERLCSLALLARRNLSEEGVENVTVVEGDGSKGLPEEAPYDRIYYTCGAPGIPEEVRGQVKAGGMILAPIGPRRGTQRLTRLIRMKSGFLKKELTYCMFVPLIGELGH